MGMMDSSIEHRLPNEMDNWMSHRQDMSGSSKFLLLDMVDSSVQRLDSARLHYLSVRALTHIQLTVTR